MEILNNIWLALTTENEMLINIFTLILTPFENYLTLNLFTTILNIPATKKQKIIYIVLLSLEFDISILLLPIPLNVFINYIFAFILIKSIFKINFLKTILATITPAITFTLLESLFLKPYLTIFNIPSNLARIVPLYRLPFALLIYLLISILIFGLKIKNKTFSFKFIENFNKKTKLILFLNLFFGLITLIIQCILNVFYIQNMPILITIFSFISIFAYFFISFYSLTRVLKLSQTTQNLESAKEYNKSLSILHDTVRGFKHDFDNIVAALGGYIKTNDMEGLKKYYFELEDDCQKANNLSTLNPTLINNPGIYSLLSSKYHKADEKNIKINLDFFVDLNDLKIKTYEFSRILGILLDNAIEASCECEEKIINIIFRNENKNNRHIVIVENTYSNKNVDTEEIFKKGVSEKENHTGLGLWEIRQYIKKNNNLNLHTSKTKNFFKQQLEIYY